MNRTVKAYRSAHVFAWAAAFAIIQVASEQALAGDSQVRDLAGMFDRETVRKAREQLDKIEREHKVPVVIETIDSLNGEPVNDVAERREREGGGQAIYVLIARDNRRISRVLVPRRLAGRLPESRLAEVRDAFIAEFKKSDFDAGLESGITALGKLLQETPPERSAPEPDRAQVTASPASSGDKSLLVVRNQAHLLLAGAERILKESEAKARAMGLKVNIAVVDDGGHLIAFARMDGARPASAYTALTKATTAATFRQATGPVPPGTSSPDPLLNLSLQSAAAASGGKLTTLRGGVPIVLEGQVIGGVGVGGGTGEQDAEVAKAGIEALLDALKEK